MRSASQQLTHHPAANPHSSHIRLVQTTPPHLHTSIKTIVTTRAFVTQPSNQVSNPKRVELSHTPVGLHHRDTESNQVHFELSLAHAKALTRSAMPDNTVNAVDEATRATWDLAEAIHHDDPARVIQQTTRCEGIQKLVVGQTDPGTCEDAQQVKEIGSFLEQEFRKKGWALEVTDMKHIVLIVCARFGRLEVVNSVAFTSSEPSHEIHFPLPRRVPLRLRQWSSSSCQDAFPGTDFSL
jgi:hypothetical protein